MPLPVLLRPKYIIRRKALRNGLFGPSYIWRSIAFFIIFRNAIGRFFGKRPEPLMTRRIGVGRVITVAAVAPMTRKDRRRTGTTKSTIEAAARADLASTQHAS